MRQFIDALNALDIQYPGVVKVEFWTDCSGQVINPDSDRVYFEFDDYLEFIDKVYN